MSAHGVLLISRYPLFAEAVAQLLQVENIEVIATVHQIEDAWPLLRTLGITSVVAEIDESSVSENDLLAQLFAPHLNSSQPDSLQSTHRVIFLTLGSNRMVVHHRQCIENVTPTDLIQVLQE